MRLTRGHPSTVFSINFSGRPGQPTPRRRQDQSRPLLQLPQSAATQSKGTGSLFLRRKVAKSTSSKGQVFTNRGKADDHETAAKRSKAADRRRAAARVARH
jgi:hypothetical protein